MAPRPSSPPLSQAARLTKRVRNKLDSDQAVINALMLRRSHKANNTLSAYAAPQRRWQEFCQQRQYDDGELVTEGKMLVFLTDLVETVRVAPGRGTGAKRVKKTKKKGKSPLASHASRTDTTVVSVFNRLTQSR